MCSLWHGQSDCVRTARVLRFIRAQRPTVSLVPGGGNAGAATYIRHHIKRRFLRAIRSGMGGRCEFRPRRAQPPSLPRRQAPEETTNDSCRPVRENFSTENTFCHDSKGAPGGPAAYGGGPIVSDYPRISGAIDTNHVANVFFGLTEEPTHNF